MSTKIKLILEDRACKHHNAFYIPIVQENDIFYTGQNLSKNKMIGEEPLTLEESEKYPYVINPLQTYKVPNGRTFDLDDPMEGPIHEAIYDLIVLSEKIAESKSEYNPSKHKGYFINKQRDAETELKIVDDFFNAIRCVREMSVSSTDAVCMMLYYNTRREDFDIEMTKDSYEIKKTALLRMARTQPKKVLECFKEFNPGVEDELLIYKLIHRQLIRKQGNDYYEATNGIAGIFLGNSLTRVKDYLSRKENEHIKGKFLNLLSEYETNQVVTIPLSRVSDEVEHAKEFIIAIVKSNILDGKIDDAEKKLKELKVLAGENQDYLDLKELIETTKDSNDNISYEELNTKSLKSLLAKIKSPATVYKYQDILEFKDDKEQIIQYILDKDNSK
jgi:hypothetical protein